MYANPAWGTRTRVWHWLTDWLNTRRSVLSVVQTTSTLPTLSNHGWILRPSTSLYKYFSLHYNSNHNITDNSLLNWCPFISFNCSYLPWRFCSVSIFLDWKFILPTLPDRHYAYVLSEIFLRDSHKVWAKTGNIFTKNLIWSTRSAGSTASSRSIGCTIQDLSDT